MLWIHCHIVTKPYVQSVIYADFIILNNIMFGKLYCTELQYNFTYDSIQLYLGSVMSRNKIVNRIKKNSPFSDKSCLKGISLTRRGILFPLSAPVIPSYFQN